MCARCCLVTIQRNGVFFCPLLGITKWVPGHIWIIKRLQLNESMINISYYFSFINIKKIYWKGRQFRSKGITRWPGNKAIDLVNNNNKHACMHYYNAARKSWSLLKNIIERFISVFQLAQLYIKNRWIPSPKIFYVYNKVFNIPIVSACILKIHSAQRVTNGYRSWTDRKIRGLLHYWTMMARARTHAHTW